MDLGIITRDIKFTQRISSSGIIAKEQKDYINIKPERVLIIIGNNLIVSISLLREIFFNLIYLSGF